MVAVSEILDRLPELLAELPDLPAERAGQVERLTCSYVSGRALSRSRPGAIPAPAHWRKRLKALGPQREEPRVPGFDGTSEGRRPAQIGDSPAQQQAPVRRRGGLSAAPVTAGSNQCVSRVGAPLVPLSILNRPRDWLRSEGKREAGQLTSQGYHLILADLIYVHTAVRPGRQIRSCCTLTAVRSFVCSVSSCWHGIVEP